MPIFSVTGENMITLTSVLTGFFAVWYNAKVAVRLFDEIVTLRVLD